jgi:xanthine dehydrogenase YagS FAD-binding subunit
VAAKSRYLKIRDRASYAFALVSAAVALDVQNGRIRDARIALGGVAHMPWRALEAERALAGQPLDEASLRTAAEVALNKASGYEDNGFKIELAKRIIVRAMLELA